MITPKKSIIKRVFIFSMIFPSLLLINGCNGSPPKEAATKATEITDSENIIPIEDEKVTDPDISVPEGINPVPEYVQDFDPSGWSAGDWITSPDGLWVVSNWGPATGGNYMLRSNFDIFASFPNDSGSGYISLKTTGSKNSPSQKLNGGEIFSPNYSEKDTQWKYGYYECRMKTADMGSAESNTGVCASFFIQSGDGLGFEVDFEFLTNGLVGNDIPKDDWVNTGNEGYVATSLHPGNDVEYINLGFNPSKDFHTYGILWLPDKVEWYADGHCVRSESGNFAYDGLHIAMNNWTGDTNWGGLPPEDDAVTYYDFVKYYTVES
ncbi:MAG: glycoside hydrolase family 16 protein [Oscillospiraceae bacterium]|nr:glycoside hydrolase family 16 protein [Oscillospiraceae bacterium]